MSQVEIVKNYLFNKPEKINLDNFMNNNLDLQKKISFSKLYSLIEPVPQPKNKRQNKETKYIYTNKIPIEIKNNELDIDFIPKEKDEFEFIDRQKYIESLMENNKNLVNKIEVMNELSFTLPKIKELNEPIISNITKIQDIEKLDKKMLIAMKRADQEAESILDKSKYYIEKLLEIEKKSKERYEQNEKILNEKYIELLKNINEPEQLKKRNMINQLEKDEFTKKFNQMEGKQSLIIHNDEIRTSEATVIFKQNQHLKNKLLLLKKNK